MLEDDADTITFSTASPNTFTSVTCARCEPALIREDEGPADSGVSLANANQAAQCCTVSTDPTTGHQVLIPPSWSLFLTVWLVTCTPVTCWRSFCRALVVLLLFLLTHGADISPDAGLLSFYISVHLSTCLASQYLLYVLETVLGDAKPSMACMMYNPGGAGLSV